MALPTDEQFPNQWHLRNTAPGLLDLNVVPVWEDYTGAGVDVFVFDDGFDRLHADLVGHYDTTRDKNYLGPNPTDALPQFTADNHGTSCMGIIGAARNGTGAVGIAYDATLIGLRGYSDDPAAGDSLDDFIRTTGDGIRHAAVSGGDVISMSNGYASGPNYFDASISQAELANALADIHYAVENGRDGLGLTIVRAMGNSRQENWDGNMTSFTSSPEMIMVTAVDQNGFVSDYSSPGASGLISAFGTPGEVFTTDRTGAPGYKTGDFNPGFNGTSAATPMVAGVVALMLEANPLLGWRDVQDILAYSARHVGTAVDGVPQDDEQSNWSFNSATTWNGGGLHFSNDYGFGLVDGVAAVRLAEHWLAGKAAETSANASSVTLDLLNQTYEIPSQQSMVFNGSYGGDFDIDSSLVTISLGRDADGFLPYMQDLAIAIYDPNGVQSIVHYYRGDTLFQGSWTFSTQAFRGQNANGQWTFELYNQGFDFGVISDVKITHRGSVSSVDDNVVFTNEFSDYATAARKTISDTDGGRDTVNAAAVTSASVIDLSGATGSRIDGVAVAITAGQFENAVGGDGGDALTGNAFNNRLIGGRGGDTLAGAAGKDTLEGGHDNDVYTVSDARALVVERAGEGVDTVTSTVTYTLKANVERLTLAGGLAIDGTGNELANRITGNGAANRLNGRAGADTMAGGAGDDIYYVDNAGDQVIEKANQGARDVVLASLSYTLAAGVEVEDLRTDQASGTGGINLTGNAFAQILRGNAGANRLNGLGGADDMYGGAGNDIYYVDDANDDIFEGAGDGTLDTAISSVTYSLDAGVGVEDLRVASAGATTAINLTGNEFAQILRGNAGVNRLNGLGGADDMYGGAGNDIYYVDNANDDVFETAGGGTLDIVIATVSYTLDAGVAVEDLRTSSSAALALTGNELGQTLRGGAGANELNGKGGADVLFGGAGRDIFVFDTALGASNIDRIEDFEAPGSADVVRLDKTIFTALAVGSLATSAFFIGAAAADAADRIIYNSANGSLFYDRDGSGAAAAIRFAVLDPGLAMTAADFVVVA